MTPRKSEPRRLTPTERLHEVTMTAMARKPAEPESSVTVARNARGVFQFEVTVRGPSVEVCELEASSIIAGLERKYPYPTNGDS